MRDTVGKIAADLLEIKAVQFRTQPPFTWSSGWLSPIYCDNRVALSFPTVRSRIKAGLIEYLKAYYPEAEAIAGVATGAIALAALLADACDKPMVYVRSAAKGHGLQNLIEGRILPGTSCVVIEDLISTGKSSVQAVSALQAAGVHVLGTLAIFSYGFPVATQEFERTGTGFYTLTNYESLVEQAIEKNYLKADEIHSLIAWQKNPEEWGKS